MWIPVYRAKVFGQKSRFGFLRIKEARAEKTWSHPCSLRHIRKWTLDMGYHLCRLVLMGGSYPLFIKPEKCEGWRHKLRGTCLSQNGATSTQAPSGIWDLCLSEKRSPVCLVMWWCLSVLLCLVYLLHVSCLWVTKWKPAPQSRSNWKEKTQFGKQGQGGYHLSHLSFWDMACFIQGICNVANCTISLAGEMTSFLESRKG